MNKVLLITHYDEDTIGLYTMYSVHLNQDLLISSFLYLGYNHVRTVNIWYRYKPNVHINIHMEGQTNKNIQTVTQTSDQHTDLLLYYNWI